MAKPALAVSPASAAISTAAPAWRLALPPALGGLGRQWRAAAFECPGAVVCFGLVAGDTLASCAIDDRDMHSNAHHRLQELVGSMRARPGTRLKFVAPNGGLLRIC